jgi:hypothetical protein
LKFLPFILVLLITRSVFGQEDNRATTLLDTFLAVDQAEPNSTPSFDVFLKRLEKNRSSFRQENHFVRFLFYKTHQEYLKRYEEYAPISDLFHSGSYNCLTGTILYALLLDHFQISYQVIETNYHIFILAETSQGKILMEATDPINGLVTSALEIESRINEYKENFIATTDLKGDYYQFTFELFRSVSLKELQGLLYYNKAVDAFNHQDLQESAQSLKKAHTFYSSPRIDEFSQILMLSLQQSNIDTQLRLECIKTVKSIEDDLHSSVASLN